MTRDEAIREITRPVVAECELAGCPAIRVYLFGSAARGEDGADSDLDFLVLLPDGAPKDLVRGTRLVEAIRGIRYPADIVPWRLSDFEGRAAHGVSSLPATIVREGQVLYEARPMAA